MSVGKTILSIMKTLSSRTEWTGDLVALGMEIGAVQRELGLDGDAPNVRLLRHYQSVGCLGRADKESYEGNRSRYAYRHLLEGVTVRVLLREGWRLPIISGTIASLDIPALVNLIHSRVPKVSLPASATVEHEVSSSGKEWDKNPADKARQLVEQFQSAAGGRPPSWMNGGYMPNPLLAQSSMPGVPPASNVETEAATKTAKTKEWSEFSPVPWLRIQVDEKAMGHASPGMRTRAFTDVTNMLRDLLQRKLSSRK